MRQPNGFADAAGRAAQHRNQLGSSPLSVGLGVFEFSADGGQLLFSNHALVSFLRLPAASSSNRPVADVFSSDQYQSIREAIGHVIATAQPRELILPASPEQEANGTPSISLEIYPVATGAGRARYALAVARPADSRAPGLEAELIQLRNQVGRLAETDRAKSDFLTLASHELRGPISLLRGYIELLTDGSLGSLPPPAARIMPQLEARVRQLNELAREMTEMSRLEGQQPPIRPTRVDLRNIVVRAISSFQPAAPRHRIILEGNGSGSPVLVTADAHRVEIIVANLMDNAIKYSPDGGEVVCRLLTSSGLALLVIIDHGIGIAAEDMPRLFTRFSRFASTERSDIPGTGLGLYLSRQLARLDGGDITVVSHLDRGSDFTLSLPAFPAT